MGFGLDQLSQGVKKKREGDAVTTGNQDKLIEDVDAAITSNFGSAIPLEITSILSGQKIDLFGAIGNFSQTWTSNYNEEVVYGRIDPIPTFSNTSRNISFTLDLVSPQLADFNLGTAGVTTTTNASKIALVNNIKVGRLAQMCYPGYETFGTDIEINVSTLKAPPLIKIRYANLISGKNQADPLIGYLKSLSVTYATDKMAFVTKTAAATSRAEYKRMSLSMEFGVLHDFQVGHDATGQPLNVKYPFNFGE